MQINPGIDEGGGGTVISRGSGGTLQKIFEMCHERASGAI